MTDMSIIENLEFSPCLDIVLFSNFFFFWLADKEILYLTINENVVKWRNES